MADSKSKLIVLDAGHPPGGGANGFGGNEATANGKIRDALRPLLEAAGYRVVMSSRTDRASEIGRQSASLKPDVFLSIHHNAAGDSTSRGFECYTAGPDYSGGVPGEKCCPKSTSLAVALARHVMAEFGLPAHGKAVRDTWWRGCLGVLAGGNNWSGPGAAVLVEMAFVSNKSDAKIMLTTNYPARAAEALFRGIQSYLGVATDVPDVPVPQEPASGDFVGKWEQAIREMQTLLDDNGFEPGEVDGIYGPKTAAAMATAQASG